MRNIAVIGAGQMGTGIAQTVAAHGMKVMLTDVDLPRAEAGKANIEKALAKLMGRGKIEAVEAEWRIPGGRCFRVRCADDRKFELFYGELYDEWRINEL